MTKYERTAILEGEVDVWFKNTQHVLNEKLEVGVVKHISCRRIAIVEKEGTCGYVNHGLQLYERTWVCPECGTVHKRDLLAANNILRQGIVELESVSKSKNAVGASSRSRLHPRISFIQG